MQQSQYFATALQHRKFLILTWEIVMFLWVCKDTSGHDVDSLDSCCFAYYSTRVRMFLFGTCLLYFVLLMASTLVSATVSNSFRYCIHFFYMQTPPVGIRGTSLRKICQKYKDTLHYATLYDSSQRLPLYSAYVFKKSDGKRKMDTPWMYEPQVISLWMILLCL